MKVVSSVPVKKECPKCRSKHCNKQVLHYSVRGGMRGTKGVSTNFACQSCGFEFYG